MKPRLLVIDDEAAIRDSLKMILEYDGYEVLTAATGEDGIAQAEREAPDLLFLDVKMPGMDGLEVLQRLRHLVEATPVVVISGHGTVSTAVEAIKLGACYYLTKPATAQEIIAAFGREAGDASLPVSVDPVTGVRTECTDCSRRDAQGGGGGIELRFGPVEVAGNWAQTQIDVFRAQDGLPLPDASPTITSYGGYAQVDVGPVTIGGAGNFTVSQAPEPVPNRQEHLQAAGYVYWPFFDNLSLKLVGTYAAGTNDPFNLRGLQDPFTNKAIAGRLRLKYFFNTL
jgi:ActR/RegA family two-component response regulator